MIHCVTGKNYFACTVRFYYVTVGSTVGRFDSFLTLSAFVMHTNLLMLIMLSEFRGGIQKELKDCLHLVIVNDLYVYNLIHCVSDGLRVT